MKPQGATEGHYDWSEGLDAILAGEVMGRNRPRKELDLIL